jgi:hypothetical protein
MNESAEQRGAVLNICKLMLDISGRLYFCPGKKQVL